ncbi:hypothetical protein QAD02_001487 [Eretmocerus hayati]|uniref:Uncharacterized protein n=1 Tax=Eretmocerus hayati TaxID=131215 RepID=A0ACC2NH44_9HYME|nr:hypothetical protein QAD02_001487 [Eretmocerus hayati]
MNDTKTTASLKWEFNYGTMRVNNVASKVEGYDHMESPTFFGGTEKNSSWKLELLRGGHSSLYRNFALHLVTSDARELSVKYHVSAESYNSFYGGISSIVSAQGIPDFEKLLDHPEFSDITLISSPESFKVNKMILMTRSPVFLAMFENDMKEKIEDSVTIPDIDPAVMRELLRYIYSGRVQSFDKVDELFRAADKYQIDDLKRKCLEVLCDKKTVENAIELLLAADSCSDERSKYRITLFIVDNIKEIFGTPGFQLLGDDALLKKILWETIDRRIL